MTDGQKVVTAYFGLFLLVPMLGGWLLGDVIAGSYIVRPLTAEAMLLIVGGYIGFLLLGAVRLLPPVRAAALHRLLCRLGVSYLRVRPVIAAVMFLVAVSFFVGGGNSYRYAVERISDAGSRIVFVSAMLIIVASVDLCYCIFVRWRHRPSATLQRRTADAMIGGALVLFANGTASLLLAGLACACVLLPGLTRRFLFVRARSVTPVRLLKATAAVIALAAFVPLAWTAGETIKRSSAGDPLSWNLFRSEVRRITSSETLQTWGVYLVSTVSTHYYSTRFAAELPAGELASRGVATPAVLPIQSMLFRLDYLLGAPLGIGRPDPGSLSRLNYVMLTPPALQNDRAGTSPGMVASFAYAFPFPASILALALFARGVASLIDTALGRRRNDVLSGVGVFLLLLFLLGAFQSPLDVLILFDENAIYLMLLTAVALAQRPRPLSNRVPRPARAALPDLGVALPADGPR